MYATLNPMGKTALQPDKSAGCSASWATFDQLEAAARAYPACRDIPAILTRAGNRLVSSAALGIYGEAALLGRGAGRVRGRGLGASIVRAALNFSRGRGVKDFYLLTEPATVFFARFSFRVIPRSAVPAPVRASAEFRGACPETATVMSLSGGCRD
jgi:amino-acid N-acetyltransferase